MQRSVRRKVHCQWQAADRDSRLHQGQGESVLIGVEALLLNIRQPAVSGHYAARHPVPHRRDFAGYLAGGDEYAGVEVGDGLIEVKAGEVARPRQVQLEVREQPPPLVKRERVLVDDLGAETAAADE